MGAHTARIPTGWEKKGAQMDTTTLLIIILIVLLLGGGYYGRGRWF